jgi:pyruvate kinase
VDFVGLSFVGNANDVLRARRFAHRHGFSPFLIAKIERRQALKNLKEILGATDGIMVARGDLGVEMPFAEIPGLQSDIVRQSRREGKPVIVATQVLESMVENPRPTRAEATDIAYSVWSGVDAVMLSGETSIGRFPVAAVQALHGVIRATERRLPPGEFDKRFLPFKKKPRFHRKSNSVSRNSGGQTYDHVCSDRTDGRAFILCTAQAARGCPGF